MIKRYFEGNSFESIYIDILRELKYRYEFKPKVRGVESKEITNLSFRLTNPTNVLVFNKARDMNFDYAKAFFNWMLAGKTDISELIEHNPFVKTFMNKGELPETFSTAYGVRLNRQLPDVLNLLKSDNGTRRAVIHILEEGDKIIWNTKTHVEYPCTNAITLLIRDNILHMYVSMRSNNMVKVINYDVFNFTMYMQHIWYLLLNDIPGLALGTYNQNIVSAHYFMGEEKLVNKILEEVNN